MHLTFSHHYPEQTYAKKVFQSLPESPVSLLHIIESLKPLIQKQLSMSSQSYSWLCFIQLQCIRICVLFTSNVFVVGQFASSSPLGQSGTKLQTSWGPRHVPSFCLIFQKIIHSKNDSVRKYRQLVLSFFCNSSLTTDNAITSHCVSPFSQVCVVGCSEVVVGGSGPEKINIITILKDCYLSLKL